MPYKDPETRKSYRKKWGERKRFESSQILCACGCGQTMREIDSSGVKRRFLPAHSSNLQRSPDGHVPKRVTEANMIQCKCECGELLPDRNKFGNKQFYINGHVRRSYPNIELPPNFSSVSSSANQSRRSKWAKKLFILRHYSGNPPQCQCCGEFHIQFLAIDHVNNDGASHRREIGLKGGTSFYSWLIKNKLPDGFRVLCHNCNMAYGIWGVCPHQS